MIGKNWNSKTGKFSEIKGAKAISKASKAQQLKSEGISIKEIASKLGMSISRIYEYLKK